MAILKKNVYYTGNKPLNVLAGDVWTAKQPGYEIISAESGGTINVHGSVIASLRGEESVGAVSVTNYTESESHLNVFKGGEILNLAQNGWGSALGFFSAGVIHNEGSIGATFMLGSRSGAAILENRGEVLSSGLWGVGTNTVGSTRIENSGLISGKNGIAILSRQGGSHESIIENSGKISGTVSGIWVVREPGGKSDVSIVNTGTISGARFSFLGEPNTDDSIQNTGLMKGHVVLGGGNDVYSAQSSGGRVFGEIRGGSGKDLISGGKFSDDILGGGGKDTISGDAGTDLLSGGSGADIFVFSAIGHSSNELETCDVIRDFKHGYDRIDLSGIDANASASGDNALIWNGTAKFGRSIGGEVRFAHFDNVGTINDYTMVYIDIDSDRQSESMVKLLGLVALTQSDFIL